ncbi:MAG: ABC transporter ATP-binding protein [Candidatus Absconditabacteria bacterium]
MISCHQVSKAYTTNNNTVVIYDKLDRSVKSGDIVAIMGPSGSGKSTLLNLISGLDVPDKGFVKVGETNISALSEDDRTRWRSQNIGFIFQQFYLVPNLTIEDNIELVIDITKNKRRFTTDEILQKVGLGGYNKRYPHQLSGGEQQRVAIARSFVADLPILLADEPTGNLDSTNTVTIMDLMISLQKESNTTIIIITHNPQVASYCNTKYTLQNGKLLVQ